MRILVFLKWLVVGLLVLSAFYVTYKEAGFFLKHRQIQEEVSENPELGRDLERALDARFFGRNVVVFNRGEYHDPDFNKTIEILAVEEDWISRINESLLFMKEERPDEYKEIIESVDHIRVGQNRSIFQGHTMMAVSVFGRTIYLNGNNMDLNEYDPKYIGCALYHETKHLEGHYEFWAYAAFAKCLLS